MVPDPFWTKWWFQACPSRSLVTILTALTKLSKWIVSFHWCNIIVTKCFMSIYIEGFSPEFMDWFHTIVTLLAIPLQNSPFRVCSGFNVAPTAESTARIDFSIACRIPSHCSWLFHWEDCCLVSVRFTLNEIFIFCFMTLERKTLIVSDFMWQFLVHKYTHHSFCSSVSIKGTDWLFYITFRKKSVTVKEDNFEGK